MKASVNWRELVESVWAEKWEAILGMAGLAFGAIAGLPWWAVIISGALIVILVVDIVRSVRKTIYWLQEKHIPLVVIVGRESDLARPVINEALAVMEGYGFDPQRYAQHIGLEQDDWVLHREGTLPPYSEDWAELTWRFLRRVQRIEGLKGKKVFHIFLNCPAALAIGLGASLGTRHLAVVYHWQPGEGSSPYAPVMDFGKLDDQDRTGLMRIKTRFPSAYQYQYIRVERPDNLNGQVYIALHLASHTPADKLGAMAAEQGAALVIIRNCYDNMLATRADWIGVACEVIDAVLDIRHQPGVERVHIALSCPLPLAFAIGMGLGIQTAACIYNWYSDREVLAPVFELNRMRKL